ncbi:hypothetical protein MXD63_22020 [Frankia sp. Cpl3]|nr:hypothetical protein [Parafrankia colletiae]MCK9902736.1 hypothetical protein [Frankia sp. Cpl3]
MAGLFAEGSLPQPSPGFAVLAERERERDGWKEHLVLGPESEAGLSQ